MRIIDYIINIMSVSVDATIVFGFIIVFIVIILDVNMVVLKKWQVKNVIFKCITNKNILKIIFFIHKFIKFNKTINVDIFNYL